MPFHSKTLIICNNFPPIIDGLADCSFILFNTLRKNNVDANVICIKKDEIVKYVKENHLQSQVYPVVNKWNLTAVFTILKLAKQQKNTTLYLQYVPFAYSKLGIPFFLPILFLLARLNGIKTYIFFHEVAVRVWGYGFNYFARGILQRCIAYLLCLLANKIYNNTLIGTTLIRPFKSTIIYIPSNFPDVSAISVEKKPIIVSFLSRYNQCLLQALQQVNTQTTVPLKLILVGKANNTIKQMVLQDIEHLKMREFVEIDTNEDALHIATTIKQAKVYIQLEKVERKNEGGISTKSGLIMAAMQIGVPIITTQGDMTDTSYFNNNHNICLIKYNVNDLTQSILRITTNSSLANTLANNATATYHNKSGWNNFIAKLNL